jgi:hypothetical protein
MKLIALGIFLATQSTFAADLPLRCWGDGVATINLLTFSEVGTKGYIKYVVGEGDDEDAVEQKFEVRSNLRSIKAGEADTLIGSNSPAVGNVYEGILLRVAPGQREAFLATGGLVYKLKCGRI